MVDSPITVDGRSQPRAERASSHEPELSAASIRSKGLALGLAAVGFTSADVLEPALSTLTARRQAGLNGDMQFTYRNPIRSTDPRHRLPTAETLVVAALAYGTVAEHDGGIKMAQQPREQPQKSSTGGLMNSAGRIARYVWADYYQILNERLEQLAEDIRAAGYKAQVLIDSNHLVDRNAAWRAGLGWYGKNANLLVPGVGSWVVLGSILTDALLEQTATPVVDGCGPCRRCLDDCPTQAIVAPGIVDARRCIAWLVQASGPIPAEFRVAVGDRVYGCDDCQEVCPPNRTAAAELPAVEVRADIGWILTADDHNILQRHGRWYIANRDPDVIRRTALVVLSNTAEPTWGHETVVDVLQPFLSGSNALLRNHAVWAARRLGLVDRLELPVCCADGDVRHCGDIDLHRELTQPVAVRFRPAQWTEVGLR